MEILHKENIETIKISLVKNYSNLNNDKNKIGKSGVSINGGKGSYFKIESTVYKNIDDPFDRYALEPPIWLYYPMSDKINFLVKKEKTIKKHYQNPFANIRFDKYERKIYQWNNKLYISYYHFIKNRDFNKIFFTKQIYNYKFIIDLNNGNFLNYSYIKCGKTLTKKFKTNSFLDIEKVFTRDLKCDTNFDDFGFVSNIFKIIDNNKISLSQENFNFNETFGLFLKKFVKFFVEKKQIKVPNNYEKLLINYYPTEKYLKKNNRKLIMSILDMCGIKSNVSNKLVHEKLENLNLSIFCGVAEIFGNDYIKYISQIDEGCYNYSYPDTKYSINREKRQYNLTKKEKGNLVKILNSLTLYKPHSINNILDVHDHARMVTYLKKYYPDIRINAQTYSSFNIEHEHFSFLERRVKRGFIKQRKYNEHILKLEIPIKYVFNNGMYEIIPFILKNDDDYNIEGGYMHHCVGGYKDIMKSLIISLRNPSNGDRITCEYDITTGESIQRRYFNNQQPPEYFNKSIQIISDKIWNLHKNKNLEIPEIEIIKTFDKIKDVSFPVVEPFPIVELEDNIF